MSQLSRPMPQAGSRLSLLLNEAGLTVYGNRDGLVALAEQLIWIAQAAADECFEVHVRSHFEHGGEATPAEVSLTVDEEVQPYFLRLPEDAEADAVPCGFELTFMHTTEEGLDDLKGGTSGALSRA